MFDTDPLGLLVVGLFVGIPIVAVWLIARSVSEVPPLKRRSRTPQAGPAKGTGVDAAVAGALPRSPTAPVASAPRPLATGPANTGGRGGSEHPLATPSGLHRPVGPTGLPPVPTGPHRRRVVHG